MLCLIQLTLLQTQGIYTMIIFKKHVVLFSTLIYILIFNISDFVICVYHDLWVKFYFFHMDI